MITWRRRFGTLARLYFSDTPNFWNLRCFSLKSSLVIDFVSTSKPFQPIDCRSTKGRSKGKTPSCITGGTFGSTWPQVILPLSLTPPVNTHLSHSRIVTYCFASSPPPPFLPPSLLPSTPPPPFLPPSLLPSPPIIHVNLYLSFPSS